MEKENAIEIEFLPVWDKWAWRVTKNSYKGNKDEVINKEINTNIEFETGKISIYVYDKNIRGRRQIPENNLISNYHKKEIEFLLSVINKRYGTPKRWRAEKDNKYYYINEKGEILKDYDNKCYMDEELYNFGNYFKTEEEAEKYRDRIEKMLTNRELEEECNSEN